MKTNGKPNGKDLLGALAALKRAAHSALTYSAQHRHAACNTGRLWTSRQHDNDQFGAVLPAD